MRLTFTITKNKKFLFQRPKRIRMQLSTVAVQLRGQAHPYTEVPPVERWVVSPVRWPVSPVASTIPDAQTSQINSWPNWRRSFISTSTWRERDASRSLPRCSLTRRRWRSGSRTGVWSRRSAWKRAWYRRIARMSRPWAVPGAAAIHRRARPATRSAASLYPVSPATTVGNHLHLPRIDGWAIFAAVMNGTIIYDSISDRKTLVRSYREARSLMRIVTIYCSHTQITF